MQIILVPTQEITEELAGQLIPRVSAPVVADMDDIELISSRAVLQRRLR